MQKITNEMILKIRKPTPRYPVLKEIEKRFSPRFFSDETVQEKDLNALFEAARWAPSAHNHQPWYFYYTKKGTKSYTNLFSTLNTYNQSWAHTAPLLILACAIATNEKGKNPFTLYDLGASVMSLILQAQSLGYYARQMGLFDKEQVKIMFKLEKNFEPFIIIALGKIGDYTTAPGTIVELELDPKPRKTDVAKELIDK
ncbi:nitroreductase family protein [Patescibacteria group bacterium]|nr:nitroreductase family protein [Patescibacteria group bacterium]